MTEGVLSGGPREAIIRSFSVASSSRRSRPGAASVPLNQKSDPIWSL